MAVRRGEPAAVPRFVLGMAILAMSGCATMRPNVAASSLPAPSSAAHVPAPSAAHVSALIDQGRYPQADSLATALVGPAELADTTDAARVPAGEAAIQAARLEAFARARLEDERVRQDGEAAAAARRDVALRECAAKDDPAEAADAYALLARILDARGSTEAAADAATRAVALAREPGADPPGTLRRALYALAAIRYDHDDAAGAESLLAIACSGRSPESESDAAALAHCLSLRGRAAWSLGRAAEGESLQIAAVEAMRRARGGDHPETAELRLSLGRWYMIATRFGPADSLERMALASLERALGPDHYRTTRARTSLAVLYEWRSKPDPAIPLFQQALAATIRWFGPDDLPVAWPASSYGDILVVVGDLAGARKQLMHALEIRERFLPPDDDDVRLSLDRVGNCLQRSNDPAGAAPYFERALAIARARLPGSLTHADALRSLAGCYERLDQELTRARPLLEEAIPIYLGSKTRPAWSLAIASSARAQILDADGRVPEAIEAWRTSADAYASLYGEANEGTMWAAFREAMDEWASGQWGRAGETFRRAVASGRAMFASNDGTLAWIERQWSLLLACEGRTRESWDAARRAASLEERFLRSTSRELTEEEALRLAGGRTGRNVLLSLATGPLSGDGVSAREALDAVVHDRALIYDEMASRRRFLSEAADPASDSLATAFERAARRAAGLEVRLTASSVPDDGLREEWRRACDDRSRIEADLADRSVAFRGRRDRLRIGLDEVAASLRPGEALVSYVRFDRARPDTSAIVLAGPDAWRRSWLYGPALQPAPVYAAFVLRSGDSAPVLVRLGSGSEVDGLIRDWRLEVARFRRGPAATERVAERRYRRIASRLRAAVWDPVARALGGIQRVYVVPDGELQWINLASLPVVSGGYVVDRGPTLHYLSSERDLVAPSRDSAPTGEGLLAMGAPDFDAANAVTATPDLRVASSRGDAGEAREPAPLRGPRSACGEFQSLRFAPLPGSETEVEDIARLFGSNDATLLTGTAATETAFQTLAPGRRIVHVATHGFFLDDGCARASSPAERGIGGTAPASRKPSSASVGADRLLLSGIVFAGANRREEALPGGDDGILTADEVASIDLSSAEWVVLSACETGVGDEIAGEGVFGLERALRMAGARTTILSLWSVDDGATREWMDALYRARLVEKRDTAESVRAASRTVLRARRDRHESTHPALWGAFVASGDWR